MVEPNELNTEPPEEVPEGESGQEEPPEEPVPVYKQENMPTGKVDQTMWLAFRGKTRKELEKPP